MGGTRRAVLAATAVAGVALLGVVAGCAPGGEPEVTPSPVTESPTPTPTPTVPAEEPTPPAETPDALPPGFPDPATWIGAEYVADGTAVVVGGVPVSGLAQFFGACFDGGSGDVCGYSISGLVPPGPDGVVAPSEATLLVLLEFADRLPDGRATWRVVDAVITRPPGGAPAYLDACDGEEGVAIYDAGSPPGADITVAAAWGPNGDVTSLVELDPGTLTCHYMGP